MKRPRTKSQGRSSRLTWFLALMIILAIVILWLLLNMTFREEPPKLTPVLPTATALSLPTATFVASTPTPITATFTPTLMLVPIVPSATAVSTVTANNQWMFVIQSFAGVEMVLVPPGCFDMGTLLDSTMGYFDTGPINRQCFTQPFWIDKYEVTNNEFSQFHGQASHPSLWDYAQRPRETISWFEAHDFCAARGGRLPTEAEWEYAARGPDDLLFPWGNTFIVDNGVFKQNSYQTTPDSVIPTGDAHAVALDPTGNQTSIVGSKPSGASWLGALDMSGNVFEWTSTIYDQKRFPYPYSKTDGREDATDTASQRVIRGGSWVYPNAEMLRATSRNKQVPSYRSSDLGFRCVETYYSSRD